MKIVSLIALILFWLFVTNVVSADSFVATSACPAYQSMRKETNPDNAKLSLGSSYSVITIHQSKSWVRIKLIGATPTERWVKVECGNLTGHTDTTPTSNSKTCPIAPDQADSYVLAISWQPTFCESPAGQRKPECKLTDPDLYQANNFTLHGLWPNSSSCKSKHYGQCGIPAEKNHCDYPPLELTEATEQRLLETMPSFGAESCLERHEWYKHGTCQTNWDTSEYYRFAIDLLAEFNKSSAGLLIRNNVGKSVQKNSLVDALSISFGKEHLGAFTLKCKNSDLGEIHIRLTTGILTSRSLADNLVEKPTISGNCNDTITIDEIND